MAGRSRAAPTRSCATSFRSASWDCRAADANEGAEGMTDMAAAGATNADRSGSIWRLVLPLMVAEVVGSLELTMIYAAMRSLIADFGSASAAGWLITSFMLSSAAGAALFGRLGDLLGRRRILLAGQIGRASCRDRVCLYV